MRLISLSCGNIAQVPWAIFPQLREISLTIDLDASHYLHIISFPVLIAIAIALVTRAAGVAAGDVTDIRQSAGDVMTPLSS